MCVFTYLYGESKPSVLWVNDRVNIYPTVTGEGGQWCVFTDLYSEGESSGFAWRTGPVASLVQLLKEKIVLR